MSKGEIRKARKAAREAGEVLTGDLAIEGQDYNPAHEFSETPQGRHALYRWAQRYDALNGAPEGDWDR